MLKRSIAKVVEIVRERESAQELVVDMGGKLSPAVSYPSLVGQVQVGDEVVVNTTAMELHLGTGGFHFVIVNLSGPTDQIPDSGHIMKLRYTPHQIAVSTVEEEDSSCRQAIDSFRSLDRMPVIVGQLHSQIGPAAAAIKRLTSPRAAVAYIMTDSAALPLGFSRLVHDLKRHGFLDATITCGQAFGGDYEAITVYTAIIAAKQVLGADAAIVCQGPGNVGTGTAYGFSGIEMGEIINAVNILGGSAIAIPRISFADTRPRHSGLSHHTITALSQIALTPALVPLPMIDQMRLLTLQDQLARTAISYRHKTRIFDGSPGIAELQAAGIELTSMGRSFSDDPEFFLAAAAAGAAAADMLKTTAAA